MTTPSTPPLPVPLRAYLDNRGFARAGRGAGTADLDGVGHALPVEELPRPEGEGADGRCEIGGVPYLLVPLAESDAPLDNVVARGQRIELPPVSAHSALLLAAGSVARPIGTGSSAAVSGAFTVLYTDGATSTTTLTAPGYLGPGGVFEAGYRYGPDGGVQEQTTVSLWCLEVPLDPERVPAALVLPATADAASDEVVAGEAARSGSAAPQLHVFALTLQPRVPGGAALAVRGARCTPAMLGDAPQTVEATLVNVGDAWLTEADELTVSLTVPLAADDHASSTTTTAHIRALAPGEQARVRIGLTAPAGIAPGTPAEGRLVLHRAGRPAQQVSVPLTLGVPDYATTTASLRTHRAPHWFTGGKFGIFIHWGVYSVPAWAPVGEDYSEWYWARMDDPETATHRHHSREWGEDFAYDDFIPMFTADRFDPRDWVELIAAAGARYFVFTAKHHDGFCLWDTALSQRSCAHLGPKRDLLRELLDAADRHAPGLYQGIYFSQPEFFNPDAPWYEHAPRNPYTGESVPYTGYTPGYDYIHDYQGGQTRELVELFDPDLIWFDISGAANDSVHVVPGYYNQAKNRPAPKDVAVNSRGGIYAYDFRTPEYATFAGTVPAAWEASRGLDPHSYGYNAATPEDAYMTTTEAVRQLVDIVSKNGNFLLDIGPRADGTIPQVMRERLTELGAWLRVNGEAVYDTTPWWRAAELGDLRFTLKGAGAGDGTGESDEAFYIHALTEPGDRLVVEAAVPIRPGSRVTLCGYAEQLTWSHDASGALVVEVPQAARESGSHVWVFKVSAPRD
ncbi:alpha-L-fucosidase [Actinospica durhamensis]|uniref:alpha-L-fucosidase n=1 Tax=Actinospica durhamensis TaxID=1508375 RepID=A0A941IU18_9ACTN|nr:alpha-L-fucosidase [Actinospica durhamensis]MBR7836758.1 alpha-L-fucosidase [Actinospica durhamensis]